RIARRRCELEKKYSSTSRGLAIKALDRIVDGLRRCAPLADHDHKIVAVDLKAFNRLACRLSSTDSALHFPGMGKRPSGHFRLLVLMCNLVTICNLLVE